jgi:site-specific recombinase XerD
MRHAQGWADYMLLELGRSDKTKKTQFESIDRLERFTGREADDITANDLRRFLRETDYSPRTKEMALTAARNYHRYCALEGYCQLNGIMAVKGPKIIYLPKPALTTEQVAAVFGAARLASEIRLVWLGLYAGLRVSEAASIKRSTWMSDRLCVVGKGRKYREVPVHPALEEVKETILSFEPLNEDTLHHACQRLRRKVGFHFATHTFRRTFATTLYEADVPFEGVGRLLGHHLPVTGLYAQASWPKLCGWLERLEYGRGGHDEVMAHR